MGILVFISVLLVAACGLIYELVAGTLASYLVGDSVFQFSTIIGTYLFAMGIGSALSRYINRGLANRFVWIELLLGVIGGFSSALLMLAFAFTQGFELILYALVIVMGVLVGLEIPLLMRIVRDRYQFRDVIAHVLTFDYLGALGASLLFPILLVPRLGLVRSAMLFGLINAACALLVLLSCAHWARQSRKRSKSPPPPKTISTPTRLYLPATLTTSISSSPASRMTSAFFSTAICNSAPATNTATMKRLSIPDWPLSRLRAAS